MHPANEPLSLLPRAHHKQRDSKPQGRSCPAKIKQTENQIAWCEARILLVTLNDNTFSRQIMCRNKFFTATNGTHRSDSHRTRACPSYSSCHISFYFLHLMKRKEECMANCSGKKAQQSQSFWWILKKAREDKDDLLSPKSPPFYRWINEFIVINVSLENTPASEQSAHDPRRLINWKDKTLTVVTKQL